MREKLCKEVEGGRILLDARIDGFRQSIFPLKATNGWASAYYAVIVGLRLAKTKVYVVIV